MSEITNLETTAKTDVTAVEVTVESRLKTLENAVKTKVQRTVAIELWELVVGTIVLLVIGHVL